MLTNQPRNPAPTRRPVALTVAGSDSGGGAGIQADLKTMEAEGVFGTSVITSVTAQHTRGVESTHLVPREEIETQLEAVFSDFDVQALKTGMLATSEFVELVTEWLRSRDIPAVVDPVMVAASGDRLLEADAESAYERLFGQATLVTPNADEVAVLTDVDPEEPADLVVAGEQLLELGPEAVLVKGGHLSGDQVNDVLVTEDGVERFTHPRVTDAATHGSGCTLASAITARLARGDDIHEAVETGVDRLGRAIRYHHDIGTGGGAVNHSATLSERADRNETARSVERILQTLAEFEGEHPGQLARLVPEVGMQIAGATPFAETPAEVAAIDGRLSRTNLGLRAPGGVRFGASSHVANALLTAREFDSEVRFMANCRYDEGVAATLTDLDWTVVSFDRTREPADADESRFSWGTIQGFESSDSTPDAIVDEGAHAKEPMTRLFSTDWNTLAARLQELAVNIERKTA